MHSVVAKAILAALVWLVLIQALDAQTKQYRDRKYGFSVTLPAGWKRSGPKRWGEQENTLALNEAKTSLQLKLYVKILKSPEHLSTDEMDRKPVREAEYKVQQRRREGFEDYRVREGTYLRHTVGSCPALSWVSEFTHDGEDMVEYLTRIRCENSNALFFAFLPTSELEGFRQRVSPIVESLQIP